MRLLVLVDVHFGPDDDRDAGDDRAKAAVEARGQQERVHDVRLHLSQVARDPEHVPRPPHPGIEMQHVKWHAGLANLFTDGSRLVDAADDGLESIRQMADHVEHHLLGAAHHERMGHVHDARAPRRHGVAYAR